MERDKANSGGAGDLLYGFDEIAGHLGLGVRQVKHLSEKGQVPTFKLGRRVCALRSRLDAWLASKASDVSIEGQGAEEDDRPQTSLKV